MVSVESWAHAAIVVDGPAAHRAGWPAGADEGSGVDGERLHLGKDGLEVTGGRLVTFINKFHERDLEQLVLLSVGQRHEADPPPGRNGLLQRHIRLTTGW